MAVCSGSSLMAGWRICDHSCWSTRITWVPLHWEFSDHLAPCLCCSCSLDTWKTPQDVVAIPEPSLRLLTEREERMCGLWLSILSLVIARVCASSLAMVNKDPLKSLCTRVGSSFGVLLHEEHTVWEVPALVRREQQFVKDRCFGAATALQGPLTRVPVCYKH